MSNIQTDVGAGRSWLKSYYAMRATFSVAWIAAAALVGRGNPGVATGLLIAYPAWDAIANLIDARRSGGLSRSASQSFNVAVSTVTALAVAYAVGTDLHNVLGIFGAWAIFAGVLQLVTGVRRWSTGGQVTMILSGAQSALVGGFFLKQATGAMTVGIMDIVPYAAFGAFYFLVSGVWLTVKRSRKSPTLVTA